jgi:hypothetical protein
VIFKRDDSKKGLLGLEVEKKGLIFEFEPSPPTANVAAFGVGEIAVAAVLGETPTHNNIENMSFPNNVVKMPQLTDDNQSNIMFEIEQSHLTSVHPYTISKIPKV